jgi:stringent starvation protein B
MTSSKPYLIRAIYKWIVDNNLTPYIAVDTSVPGVMVPKEHIQDESITLDISVTATSNLIIGNNSLEFKARFGGISRNVYIPISAIMIIYAQENDQGMEFPPEEFEEFAEELPEKEYAATPPKNKPKLTLVTGGKN